MNFAKTIEFVGWKTKLFISFLAVCFSISLGGVVHAAYGSSEQRMPMTTMMMAKPSTELRDGMRKLWSDHVFLTRIFIISAVANMPEAGLNAERLLKNQDDIGNAIKPYYGNAAGDKLTALLREHILIAADIVSVAKKGDMTAVGENEKRWIDNADEIALFLGSANPNWSRTDMKDMLYQHLALTKTQLLARLSGEYSGDITNFDQIYAQGLMMADNLSNGIVKQFPRKF